MHMNILLHRVYVPTQENPADAPSRRLSPLDCKLAPEIWDKMQKEFSGAEDHSCDLMALDSNTMTSKLRYPLPHFTPYPSPDSMGVNMFSQDLTKFTTIMRHIFRPNVFVGPVLCFLQFYKQSCTIVVLDTFPWSYWWPLLQNYSGKARMIAGQVTVVLLLPSRQGWSHDSDIPGDLWAFLYRDLSLETLNFVCKL